jgi:hypothetical protein
VGNKTSVIKKVYDRLSRLAGKGFSEVRVGSIETTRKHTDLPVLWVSLEGGREAGNFKNAASVDAMRVSINILDNKLKLTNNTLFREPENGGGDTYTLSTESDALVQDDILAWFSGLRQSDITTSSGINGASILTSGRASASLSVDLSIDASTTIDLSLIDLLSELNYRDLTIGDSIIKVLCLSGALPGFAYNGVSLGTSQAINFEGGALTLLSNIKKHALSIDDEYGDSKSTGYIYTYNTGAAVSGDSVTIGTPGSGALIRLERALDQLDLNDSGGRDITFDGKVNNRRDIEYRVDESGDHVFIQAIIDLESAIFINGARRGDL